MQYGALSRLAACIGGAVAFCGCSGDAGPTDIAPVAAESAIPVAARSATGVDYPPGPVAPRGPQTATGANPFLPAPTSQPVPEPLVPDPPKAPADPAPTAVPTETTTQPGGTPL